MFSSCNICKRAVVRAERAQLKSPAKNRCSLSAFDLEELMNEPLRSHRRPWRAFQLKRLLSRMKCDLFHPTRRLLIVREAAPCADKVDVQIYHLLLYFRRKLIQLRHSSPSIENHTHETKERKRKKESNRATSRKRIIQGTRRYSTYFQVIVGSGRGQVLLLLAERVVQLVARRSFVVALVPARGDQFN